jgi:hypothetical protein
LGFSFPRALHKRTLVMKQTSKGPLRDFRNRHRLRSREAVRDPSCRSRCSLRQDDRKSQRIRKFLVGQRMLTASILAFRASRNLNAMSGAITDEVKSHDGTTDG